MPGNDATTRGIVLADPSAKEIEEGLALAPKFDADGLVTCVATDAGSGELLMVAHMNAEALRRTIETGEAWYFSRSRKALWKKGESSGHTQRVVEMRVDCDQDAVWIKVEQQGAGACHTGRRSCFYRLVPLRQTGAVALEFPRRREGVRSARGLRQEIAVRALSTGFWPAPAIAARAPDAGGRTSRRRCPPCRRQDCPRTPRSPPRRV